MPWVAHDGAWRAPGRVVPFNGITDPDRTFYLGSSSADAWTNIDEQLRNPDGTKLGASNNGLAVRRSFNGGGLPPTFSQTAAQEDVARGVASIWSCKPDIYSVASGSMDQQWVNFFNSIPPGHRAWLCMWHEPWDDFTAEDWPTYRAAQARVSDILQASNADENLVKWGIITTAFDYQQGRADLMFPEDNSNFSWVGVDGYNFWRPATAPPDPRGRDTHRTPQQIYGAARNFALQRGDKPLIVAEWAHHDNPTDPAQRPMRIDESINWMLDNNTIAASYFHSHHGDSGPWWLNCHHNYNDPQDQSNTDEATLARYRNWLALYGKHSGDN